ncbi:unnamed protein product [Agarophyton chilense]
MNAVYEEIRSAPKGPLTGVLLAANVDDHVRGMKENVDTPRGNSSRPIWVGLSDVLTPFPGEPPQSSEKFHSALTDFHSTRNPDKNMAISVQSSERSSGTEVKSTRQEIFAAVYDRLINAWVSLFKLCQVPSYILDEPL